MHEQSIAQQITREAQAQGEVLAIVVEVGDLAHLPAGEMREVLEKMTEWEVKVKAQKSKVKCKCGFIGEPKILQQMHDHNIYECPACAASMPDIVEGDQIVLKEVIISGQ